jgi:large subunit ribosomal protein L15
MPLAMRLRKVGFRNPCRRSAEIVNLSDLERFGAGSVVDAEALKEAGLVQRSTGPVKVLGNGEVRAALTLRVHAVSAAARQKLEAAGGTIEVLPSGPKGPKPRRGGDGK